MPLVEVVDGIGFYEDDEPVEECPLGCHTLYLHPNEGPYTAHRNAGITYCEAARAGRSASLRQRYRQIPVFKYTRKAKEDVDACVRAWGSDAESGPVRVEDLRSGWCTRYLGAWRRIVMCAPRGGQTILDFYDGPQVTLMHGYVTSVFRPTGSQRASSDGACDGEIEANVDGGQDPDLGTAA